MVRYGIIATRVQNDFDVLSRGIRDEISEEEPWSISMRLDGDFTKLVDLLVTYTQIRACRCNERVRHKRDVLGSPNKLADPSAAVRNYQYIVWALYD